MDELDPEHLLSWKQNKIDFETLLLMHPQHSHASLGYALGLPHHEKIISAKWKGSDYWPVMDRQRIRDAQQLYDAGEAELTQLRVHNHFLLLLFPRVVRAKPRAYFKTMTVMSANSYDC